MNELSAEEVRRLREAFDRGLGVRAAAREVGVNRETCGKYFGEWKGAPLQDPNEYARRCRLLADVAEWYARVGHDRAVHTLSLIERQRHKQ